MPRSRRAGQVMLELVLSVIGIGLFLGVAGAVFGWLNRTMIERQQAYEADRALTGKNPMTGEDLSGRLQQVTRDFYERPELSLMGAGSTGPGLADSAPPFVAPCPEGQSLLDAADIALRISEVHKTKAMMAGYAVQEGSECLLRVVDAREEACDGGAGDCTKLTAAMTRQMQHLDNLMQEQSQEGELGQTCEDTVQRYIAEAVHVCSTGDAPSLPVSTGDPAWHWDVCLGGTGAVDGEGPSTIWQVTSSIPETLLVREVCILNGTPPCQENINEPEATSGFVGCTPWP